ncbi:ABC transporter family protein, partial [Vibrio parahaemolyticus V-223/04]
LVQST